MKNREYRRLAKLSLASRKKTTRSTVRGLSFGLILLIPVIFLSMGLNIDLKNKINENVHTLYATVNMAAEGTNIKDQRQDFTEDGYCEGVFGSGHYDEIEQKLAEQSKVFYETLAFSSIISRPDDSYNDSTGEAENLGLKYAIGDDELVNFGEGYISQKSSGFNYGNVAIVDLEKSNSQIAIDSMLDYYNDVYIAGNGFEGDGRGQIILGEDFVRNLGVTPAEICGQTLTWQFEVKSGGYFYLDNNIDPYDEYVQNNYSSTKNMFLFNKYEVVGVIKDSVNKDAFAISEYYAPKMPLASGMVLSKASTYINDSKDTLVPIILENEENKTVATYLLNDEQFKEANKTCVAKGVMNSEYGDLNYGTTDDVYAKTTLMVGAESYGELDNTMLIMADIFEGVFEEGMAVSRAKQFLGSDTYYNFNMLFMIVTYSSILLLAVGGIIFFAAIINLFNTIMHSIDSRKNYLGVMRAIGAKPNVIPKLYLFETLTIFRRVLVWIAIFGGSMCVVIKLLIDWMFSSEVLGLEQVLGTALSIDWIYIVITFLIITVVLITIGWLFSYICARKIARQNIVEVLEAN